MEFGVIRGPFSELSCSIFNNMRSPNFCVVIVRFRSSAIPILGCKGTPIPSFTTIS